MINFLKGIIVGIGGIAPGLSGSVLLVILGLYQKAINAIGTLFKDFKNNVKFLLFLSNCKMNLLLLWGKQKKQKPLSAVALKNWKH